MTYIEPHGDVILVLPDEREDRTECGLIIPDMARKRACKGVVGAIGTGRRTCEGTVCPPDVTVGDHVAFNEFAGDEMTVNGQHLLLIREKDILAVLEV